ncbi:MAG: DsbA family protein [Gemmatimonadales bacterium]
MRRSLVTAAALLALCAAAAAQADPLAARSKGRPDAPVTVYEMSDFQCPYCRVFALTTMPILEREYVATGKARFVFINLPLTGLHAHAMAAAEVAMCAARQQKFWPMHNLLFQRQDQWARRPDPGPYFLALGDTARVERAALARCLASKAMLPLIREDSARAAGAGARSTPTFYIEGGLLEGAAPVEVFRTVLDSIHRAKTR